MKRAAIVFGVVFLLIGILGFIPGITHHEMLLGIFHVNAAHNVVHLLSGAVAFWAGMHSASASQTYFKIFGIIYGLVALLGMFVPHGMLLGILSNNVADTALHVVIAVASLYLGFAYDERMTTSHPR